MKIPYSINPGRHRALELLLSRHSPWPLVAPGPSEEELALVFAAALRAADHGRLRPWRFLLIRDDALATLGDVYAQVAQRAGKDVDPERARAKALAAPMVIAVAARLDAHSRIPEHEQWLSAGAAAMNMLNALHMMGYGGFWKSPPGGPDGPLRSLLGFASAERIVAMLYVGTVKGESQPPVRPNASDFVSEWKGGQARVL